jgi:hypothetical protein
MDERTKSDEKDRVSGVQNSLCLKSQGAEGNVSFPVKSWEYCS